MKKWSFIIDVAKCHDCNNCYMACKDEHIDNDWPPVAVAQPKFGHRWMNIQRREAGGYPLVEVAYLPQPCQHCDDAPCVKKGNGAVTKRKDGIVIIDPKKAKGMKDLVDACPYGAIFWNDEASLPQKCTFCAHLLDDGWKEPRCVQVCPTGALRAVCVEQAELDKMIKAEGLEVYLPELKAKPRTLYKNLHRFTKEFLLGNVAVQKTDECAEGAKVTLLKGEKTAVAETFTNNYGDFKFEGLPSKGGNYRLEIEYGELKKKGVDVTMKDSVTLGTIFL